MFRNGYIYVRIRHMLRDKSNKRDRIRSNLLATLSKSGTAMAVPAVPVATALYCSLPESQSRVLPGLLLTILGGIRWRG